MTSPHQYNTRPVTSTELAAPESRGCQIGVPTPDGRPASTSVPTTRRAVARASSGALKTAEHPAAGAAPSLRVASTTGKFHALMRATAPSGVGMEVRRDPGDNPGNHRRANPSRFLTVPAKLEDRSCVFSGSPGFQEKRGHRRLELGSSEGNLPDRLTGAGVDVVDYAGLPRSPLTVEEEAPVQPCQSRICWHLGRPLSMSGLTSTLAHR